MATTIVEDFYIEYSIRTGDISELARWNEKAQTWKRVRKRDFLRHARRAAMRVKAELIDEDIGYPAWIDRFEQQWQAMATGG